MCLQILKYFYHIVKFCLILFAFLIGAPSVLHIEDSVEFCQLSVMIYLLSRIRNIKKILIHMSSVKLV